ncbi:hypothetical protein [Mycoplasma sp. Mirounga ES2805-ORL]|uniref:hypothetical protein n=1 Tax=Mycoplasma sp. Mirounga ES2805-ORL TaxID=754514 RepID=UPI00197B0B8B|nr:hypothetical protein [Mycoplasma sp. Mirounga ES2805-ORL]QSF13783.1 hypothetical protein JXZ90_00570 [Mycoplasma sp. Mirounga ES2805-ORL]
MKKILKFSLVIPSVLPIALTASCGDNEKKDETNSSKIDINYLNNANNAVSFDVIDKSNKKINTVNQNDIVIKITDEKLSDNFVINIIELVKTVDKQITIKYVIKHKTDLTLISNQKEFVLKGFKEAIPSAPVGKTFDAKMNEANPFMEELKSSYSKMQEYRKDTKNQYQKHNIEIGYGEYTAKISRDQFVKLFEYASTKQIEEAFENNIDSLNNFTEFETQEDLNNYADELKKLLNNYLVKESWFIDKLRAQIMSAGASNFTGVISREDAKSKGKESEYNGIVTILKDLLKNEMSLTLSDKIDFYKFDINTKHGWSLNVWMKTKNSKNQDFTVEDVKLDFQNAGTKTDEQIKQHNQGESFVQKYIKPFKQNMMESINELKTVLIIFVSQNLDKETKLTSLISEKITNALIEKEINKIPNFNSLPDFVKSLIRKSTKKFVDKLTPKLTKEIFAIAKDTVANSNV